ncbi:hypothetical protein MPF_1509 [Methanohalophilus portucalensis FDF-1]|uniref:Uncharacterized protein n=1 Tax=Methanohalophilus portucalensis FDF-1 TaxID=523843 RepID=A0A1L9C3E6_9EURY|nr:hypothetical protein MPF_1509 [Methanohalophilus portucalensis FDF-1]
MMLVKQEVINMDFIFPKILILCSSIPRALKEKISQRMLIFIGRTEAQPKADLYITEKELEMNIE